MQDEKKQEVQAWLVKADNDLRGAEVDIRRVIQTSGAIVDALGTSRNRATLAHPNEELLGHEEAVLVINVARSLLRFLDAKLAGR